MAAQDASATAGISLPQEEHTQVWVFFLRLCFDITAAAITIHAMTF